MRVLIGYDEREYEAAQVAAKSLRRVTNGEIEPEFLCLPKLVDQGLITRVTDRRGEQAYDLVSNAPMSTEFAITRFLTPILCQQGYALFVDCDVVFLRDPREMLTEVHARHALNVVWHENAKYPDALHKMVDQVQTQYPRKNASSVMLFNCDHAANRRLSLRDVNERPGRDLHAFYWLHDSEIGVLWPGWNWLVDVEPRPQPALIAHMTLGGPWLEDWQGGSFDEEWWASRES
jgi:hypothetical protein